MLSRSVLLFCTIGAVSCAGDQPPSAPTGIPSQLEFEFSRQPAGQPVAAEEVARFTAAFVGFTAESEYFKWIMRHSHGLHRSYDPAMPDYSLWFDQTRAVKSGDTVVFRHDIGSDNLMIRHSKMTGQLLAGYSTSTHSVLGEPLRLFSRGVLALFDGMIWANEDPPIDSIMARALYGHNHSYTTDDGRKVQVDYRPVRVLSRDITAHTVPNPQNPTWGDIWLRNIRSKDDLPHIYRLVPLLMMVQESTTGDARLQAQLAQVLQRLRAFAADIIDHGYYIRTKEDGLAFTVEDSLANFVAYDELVEGAECNAKLATALIARGEAAGNACSSGYQPDYEELAGKFAYYNLHIARYFHLAALSMTLVSRHNVAAQDYLAGMAMRADDLLSEVDKRSFYSKWDADVAAFLVLAAAWGLPLTGDEVRHIHQRYAGSFAWYAGHPEWDLWDAAVADGEYTPVPRRFGETVHVHTEELAFFFEYCRSPFRNPAGEPLVECDRVLATAVPPDGPGQQL